MDPVRDVLKELVSDPERFQETSGYERLLALLHEGHSPVAIKELLRENSAFAGDILWTVCELDDPAPFVEEAARHMSDEDRGAAAYAIEVVLRAAEDGSYLRNALDCLASAPTAVREHAARVLASRGLLRAREVFGLGNWTWAAKLVDGLLDKSRNAEATLRILVADSRGDRLMVGLMIATLASEHDGRAARILEQSELESVRDFGGQLRRMFEHRWSAR